MEHLLNIEEAARMLGISHWTLRLYLRQGKIPSFKLGRRIVIRVVELERFVSNHQRE